MEKDIEITKIKEQDSFKMKVTLKYYLNNSQEKQVTLKVLNFDNNYDKILYEEITCSFYRILKRIYYDLDADKYINSESEYEYLDIKPNNIKIEFIRYFDGGGWILLEEDDVIQLNNRLNSSNLKIMIKAKIVSEEKIKIDDKYRNIEDQIKYIYSDLKNIGSNNYEPEAPLNLIVLTANPLMNDEKELRTMNDFNIIPAMIYKLFQEEDYLKYTEFLPLTKKTLQEILIDETRRPLILHLICKSTYILDDIILENTDNNEIKSELFTNLIFEQDDDDKSKYDLEFINKKELKYIFDDEIIKKNIEKITLIISTPLAEDVYNLFKDFGFKNLLVQHTTLADVNYVADSNYTFYKEIIIRKSVRINKLYELALHIYMEKANSPTFCCCFHKHKNNCYLLKNIKNELFNEKDEMDIKDIKKCLPHLYHLFPDCNKSNKCFAKINSKKYNKKIISKGTNNNHLYDSFTAHHNSCVELYFSEEEIKEFHSIYEQREEIIFYNLCCCNEDAKIHNINNIFFKDFNENNKNNTIRFRIAEMMTKKKFFPDYDKMKLLVGKNKIVFDIITFFHSKELYCNIYGDNTDKLKELINITIEYYKEKNYDLYELKDEKEIDLRLKKIKSTPQLAFQKKLSHISFYDLGLQSKKSNPLINNQIGIKFDFIEYDLKKDSNDFKFDNSNNNIINLIYVHDSDSLNRVKKPNKKTIFLSKEQLEQLNNNKKFGKITFIFAGNAETKQNKYIRCQNLKNCRNDWRKKKF